VFFAALTFTGVNVANLLYYRRIRPDRFRFGLNFVVPLAGVGFSLYLMYAAFFSALWSEPFRMGGSVVVVCLALLGLQAAATVVALGLRPDLSPAQPPVGADLEAS